MNKQTLSAKPPVSWVLPSCLFPYTHNGFIHSIHVPFKDLVRSRSVSNVPPFMRVHSLSLFQEFAFNLLYGILRGHVQPVSLIKTFNSHFVQIHSFVFNDYSSSSLLCGAHPCIKLSNHKPDRKSIQPLPPSEHIRSLVSHYSSSESLFAMLRGVFSPHSATGPYLDSTRPLLVFVHSVTVNYITIIFT